jgi:hypothetical protein
MNLSSILVFFLLLIAGLVYVFQTKPGSDENASKPKEERMADRPTQNEPASVSAQPAPLPAAAVVESPAPIFWYTARRVSSMTDTGVFSVPAGVEVTKVSDTEILFNGKRFTVKPGDLTTDVLVVADILSQQNIAARLVEKERQTVAATEQANIAAVQSHAEDKVAQRRAQVAAAIASIDRQIAALQAKIQEAQSDATRARIYNRVSGSGPVITKCERAIAKLQAERHRLSGME